MLIGRDAEVGRIRAVVADRAGREPQVLVLRGDPGIGKTATMEHGTADPHGRQVVRVRGHEAEREIPFAALSMLVGPLQADTAELTPAQGAALEGALNLGPAVHGDRAAVGGAVLALLAAAAERQPLLLTVDDLHLVDRPTADALLFALRRTEHEALIAVLTARLTVDVGPTLDRALEGFTQLELGGLDLPSARQLTVQQGHLSESAWRDTGGNPLALLEIAGSASHGAGRAERAVSGTPAPLSARLQRAYEGRLAGLDTTTRDVLLLVAASSRADVLDDALAQRGLSRRALDPAEAAGLVVQDAGTVSFTHPLVRSTVYHSVPPAARRAVHRTLADACAGRTTDGAVERRAFHLATATVGPDDEVAVELAEAAARAEKRHSLTTAAALFERSARLSSPGTARTLLIIRAAVAGQAAGTVELAGPLLAQALAESDDDDLRTTAAHLQCRVEMWSGHPAVARDRLLDLADDTEERHPRWSAIMRAQAATVSIALGEQRLAAGMARRAVELARGTPDEAMVLVLVSQAVTTAINGETDTAVEMLARCAPHLPACDPFSIDQVLVLAALGYVCVEDLTTARRWLTDTVRQAQAVGATGLLPFQLSWLALVCWLIGDWLDARAHGLSAVQAAEETGWTTELPNCLIALGLVEATLGREDDALQHAGRAEDLGRQHSATRIFAAHAARVRGLTALGAGRHDEAAALFAEVGDYARAHRMGESVLFPWAGNLTESLVRAQRPEDARAAQRTAAAEAERSGLPTARAVAARCAGLLADSAEDGRRAFEDALDAHRTATQPFEQARTELCYGEFLRRHRRWEEARVHLGRARGTFARLGATAWLERTQAELVAGGDATCTPTPSLQQVLTSQELQVAVAVGAGVTNKEVAAQLNLSPKTVESHLTKIYSKLGFRSRNELIKLLATG